MSISISDEDRIIAYALSFSYLGVALANTTDDLTSKQKAAYNGMFAMNVLGYIPGVSLIVGIARIIFSQISAFFTQEDCSSKQDYKSRLAIQEAQLTRGVLECCTFLSPLVLIADIAVSILYAAISDKE